MSCTFTLYLIDKNYLNIDRYSVVDGSVVENYNSIFNNGVTKNDNHQIKVFINLNDDNYRLIKKSNSEDLIYYRESDTYNPWWKIFWNIPEDIFNKSTDVVIIKELFGRIFVITHGHGRHLINPLSYEYDFGLKTALNVIDEGNIRSANLFTPSDIAMRTMKQTGKSTRLVDFEIDIYKTLLKNISGKVNKEFEDFFSNIEGADCIKFSYDGTRDGFDDIIEKIYTSYNSDNYKTNGFEWIDNFRVVKNQFIITQLDKKLVDEINSKSTDVSFSCPFYRDSTVELQFKYKGIKSASGAMFPLIDIETQYYDILGKNKITVTIDELKKHQVAMIDYSSGNEISAIRVYQLLYFEIKLDIQSFFLESGRWYKVDDKFVTDIDHIVNLLLDNKVDFGLKYDVQKYSVQAAKTSKNNEFLFNQDLANKLSALGKTQLLDCDLVRHKKNSIELCDVLYQKSKDSFFLIHNKQKYGSSALSHLFSQGFVSADLLTDSEFVKVANNKIKDQNLKLPINNSQDRSKYTVVYGIILKFNKKGQFTIPLFSKINLNHFHKSLVRLGYKVSISIIEMI